MITLRLPDGQTREVPDDASVADAIRAISEGLARHAVAAKINGQLAELNRKLADQPLSEGAADIQVLTLKDEEGLEMARHSCAHVMAEAICDLWPQTKLVYGPPVENGFYYDIDLDHNLSPEDFAAIEARMKKIVKEKRPFTRYEMTRAAGLEKLSAEDNAYKVDNAERADGDVLSFYVTGAEGSGCWEDLCRGPHVPTTDHVGAYKIMSVAGAYWHGDASKQVLQRVYGTTWPDKKALKAYLNQLEEAKKRDHRKLGKELGLFTIDDAVGTGLVLWKPRGAIIRYTLEQAIRSELIRRGYQPVYTPQIGKLELYRTSGHFPYYKDSQYPPIFESERARELNYLWEVARGSSGDADEHERGLYEALAKQHNDIESSGYPFDGTPDERVKRIQSWLAVEDGYLLRPMNCPHHVKIFDSDHRSYRDLPVRLAEFGTVYRYEQSGEVSGLTRVRGLTQDDAHLFCTQNQLSAEIEDCVDLAKLVLGMIGLDDYRVRVSLRDPESDKYIGSDENWNKAEDALRGVVKAAGVDFFEATGEAAFYGPKLDFVVKDALQRDWQLGTIQVDYNLPERFDLKYVGEDNTDHRPVMVHRAPFGSLERFIGILIEHFAGAFPLWLAPVQVVICPISEKAEAYAKRVFEDCTKAMLRCELDTSGDRVGAKIRRATLEKVPYILVVGEEEAREHTVNVRTRTGAQLGSPKLSEFIHATAIEIAERRHALESDPAGGE